MTIDLEAVRAMLKANELSADADGEMRHWCEHCGWFDEDQPHEDDCPYPKLRALADEVERLTSPEHQRAVVAAYYRWERAEYGSHTGNADMTSVRLARWPGTTGTE